MVYHEVVLLVNSSGMNMQLEALQPATYKSLHEYGNRYCIGGNFGVYQGSSNLQELHGLVKATVMIRRLKRDVLSQLPQKRRQQVFIALDDKGIKQMRALFHELESIRRAIKATSEDEFERLKYSEKQLVNKIYTDSAVAKLPAVQDYLTTLLEVCASLESVYCTPNCKHGKLSYGLSGIGWVEQMHKRHLEVATSVGPGL
jgi:hypothetical protein